jgi:hypothetical protein
MDFARHVILIMSRLEVVYPKVAVLGLTAYKRNLENPFSTVTTAAAAA